MNILVDPWVYIISEYDCVLSATVSIPTIVWPDVGVMFTTDQLLLGS